MRFFALVFMCVCSFAAESQAESLKDCKLYVHGKIVEEVKPFDINGYLSAAPEATIDGNLLDYSQTAKAVMMSFSNECDNMYEITFSKAALAKAKSGEFRTLIGKASIGTADMEKPLIALLKCSVVN